jgi:hypothetical protein
MSKQDEAQLILKLYELRREEKMRAARDWFFAGFHPESKADFDKTMFGEQGAYLRMVTSYWDMAAALVNHGAISVELFTDTNGEYLITFAKLEPILGELREAYGPQFLANLEKLIDATPGGRERIVKVRERMAGMRAQIESAQARAAQQS